MIQRQQRLEKLRALVAYHRQRYHRDDAPEITDAAYDALVLELRDLEIEVEGRARDSELIGGAVVSAFSKVTHQVPQWSFDNVFDFGELTQWDERAMRVLKDADVDTHYTYVAEHKIDGLKLVLTYKAGTLVRAVTRGDGVVGEDVTHTARTIATLPAQLSVPIDLICVGEVWLSQKDFIALNTTRKKEGLPLFANPRNAAAGSLRQLDPAVARARKLSLYCYDIDYIHVQNTKLTAPVAQYEELALLETLDLPTNPHATQCATLRQVQNYYDTWHKKVDSLPYGVDGIVVKINEIPVQEVLGYTAKAPRFGIAYKFPADQTTTVIEAIDLQVGRTGVVTPVAHLRPVLIAGSTVARATLHNEDQIKRLDIRVGDTVILQKAGDVIPEVVAVVNELRPNDAVPYVFPKYVAGCGGNGEIERIPGEAAYRCVVIDSPLIHRQRVYYFVSKTAFNIDGVGPKIIDQLLDAELISTAADLFTLRFADVRALPGFKDKSAQNVIDAIAVAKVQPLYRVLVSLGIEQVGEETARLLAGRFTSVKEIQKATKDELCAVHGIGEVVAESIVSWMRTPEHEVFLDSLLSHITIQSDITDVVAQTLQGCVVVATGSLQQYSRDEIKDVIRRHGGTVASSVSKKTTFVVVGAEAGSKAADAVRLGVPLLTEAEFIARIAQ